MATATFSGQYGHNMTLEVWSDWNRQDIANNRSTVNVQARLRSNGYASVWGVTAPVTVTVNGHSESSNATINIGTNSSLLFYGKDFVVPHNGDGTKTVGIKLSIGLNVGGYGSSMVAFDLPLPTIARASTGSVKATELGKTATISIDRKSSSFKHTLRYDWNGRTGTIASNVDTSYSWTIPLDFASAIPNATSSWGRVFIDTYNGSTKVGTKEATFTANVPASIKPTLGSITLTDSNTTVKNLLGTANTFVQVMSNIQVAFNNASGSYGSTISSYRAEIVGKNQSTNSNNGRLGIMNFNGTVTIRASVTDSRGRTSNTVDVRANVINYFTPQLSFSARRSGSTSTTVTVTRNARIAPLTVGGSQKNRMMISFKYKEHSASSYTNDTGSASGTWTTMSELVNSSANLGASFSVLKSYDLIGVISDNFTSYEYKISLGTESYPLAIRPDRIGFGKTPEIANSIDSAYYYFYNGKSIQHHKLTYNDGTSILLTQGTDFNTITTPGFYRCYNPINAPTVGSSSGWKYLRVTKHDDQFLLQEVIDYRGGTPAFRIKDNSGNKDWKSWQDYAIQNTVASFTAVNQTKVYSATINGPYDLNAKATRCGNIVNFSLNCIYKHTHQVTGKANETIPVGWRPTTPQIITLTGHAGGGTGTQNWADSFVDLTYNTDGSINFTAITKANPLAMYGSITWITTDPFPAG